MNYLKSISQFLRSIKPKTVSKNRREFLAWFNTLAEQDKKDFLKIFGEL